MKLKQCNPEACLYSVAVVKNNITGTVPVDSIEYADGFDIETSKVLSR